jgi:periplasmic divalent cation tolerance protein
VESSFHKGDDVMKCIAVLTTTSGVDEARKIAQELIRRRLAACVQISEIESFYVWEGTVHDEPEYRLLIKTTDERYPDVERTIRELHSYELPAIYAFTMDEVYEPYADWVKMYSRGIGE